ncbi:ribonuclease R [Alicyclobacillus tolerans]|uniref:ribonuclease R n=1 Tax=Alicyclobacillus tolerans TaxID=90970 RepID=UPI001F01CC31|nr:ribonuclease R [Alicyclobacillus tolerans]MCF8568193.1 ribonuclease R [Alicyclobacillus tolerans]
MVDRNELIAFMQHDVYRPLTVQELVAEFGMDSGDDFRAFMKLLNELEEQGAVVRTRTNRYGVPERMNLVVGRLQMKARGYAFLISEIPGEPDLYIAGTDLNGALSGDKVMARVERATGGPRREGKVIRVLERANNRLVGKFTKHRDHAFISPLDKRFPQDVFIAGEDTLDAHDGYIVVVEITAFPTPTRGPEGKVVEVLGHPDAPGVDILGVIRKYGLPEEFPENVIAEAEAIPLELSAADYEGRRDLRDEVIVTIDGEDAKDLDDAVHVKPLANGNFELGVHIADVGYYVKEDSQLDKEAYTRGTSVYLVDRVIPMLPQRLSNNVCSLNPQVDRLTMSCIMEITPVGEVVNHEIFPSVIRTTERMTYTNVNRILVDRDEETVARYRDLEPLFLRMEELARILRTRRMERGAIDFDFDEVKVIVDDLGHPTDVLPRKRAIAERLIEEFMLVANETVAEHFFWLNTPFLYRIHEEPDLDRMLEFNEFVHNFGLHVKGLGNKIHPRSLQQLLEKVDGTREQRVISTLLLRSMKQARYAPECVGHFGLAAEYYTHFTSPIRRYPDLMIHRIIREALRGKMGEEREERLREKVDTAAIQSSERERVAQDAERETDQLKMVEYMLDHLEEEFDGIISGVTQFGLFIQLQNGIEGLIHISYMADDYYVLNEKQMALVGERTRRVFRLGDPIRVQVIGASKQDLTIDFELVSHLREGTMVVEDGVSVVIYDEDLGPKERRRQIAERQSSQNRRGGRHGSRYGHENHEGQSTRGGRSKREGQNGRSEGHSGYGRGDAKASEFKPGDKRRRRDAAAVTGDSEGDGHSGRRKSGSSSQFSSDSVHGSSRSFGPSSGSGAKRRKGKGPSDFVAGGVRAGKKAKARRSK